MRVVSSLKQAKLRHRDCQVVKRRGPRLKCVQGRPKPKRKNKS